MRVLVTGGAGYVGSHTCWRLAQEGHSVTILDSLARGFSAATRGLAIHRVDVRDRVAVMEVFRQVRPEAVVHFAGLAIVPESMRDPQSYWDVNVTGGLAILAAGEQYGVKGIVFSSTCAVYGAPGSVPIAEDHPRAPVTPYGRSKLAFEGALRDVAAAGRIGGIALRYFNAAGAAPEAGLGEDHRPETHLIPNCLLAALGALPDLPIFGEDHPTADGTCVRDYVHVLDLADAHVRAIARLEAGRFEVCNLGTGHGHSVREVLNAARRVTGRPIPSRPAPRREGDPPVLVAAPGRARALLGWQPLRVSIEEMIESAWRWRSEHPDGY